MALETCIYGQHGLILGAMEGGHEIGSRIWGYHWKELYEKYGIDIIKVYYVHLSKF